MWLAIFLIVTGVIIILFSYQSLIWILGVILLIIGIFLFKHVKSYEEEENKNNRKHTHYDNASTKIENNRNRQFPYDNHCWNCGTSISNETNIRCPNCGWYICKNCGACGCEYHK